MARPFAKIRFHHYVLTAIWPPLAYAFTGQPLKALLASLALPIVALVPAIFGVGGGVLGMALAYFVVLGIPAMMWLNQYEGRESKKSTNLSVSGALFWAVVLIGLGAGAYYYLSTPGAFSALQSTPAMAGDSLSVRHPPAEIEAAIRRFIGDRMRRHTLPHSCPGLGGTWYFNYGETSADNFADYNYTSAGRWLKQQAAGGQREPMPIGGALTVESVDCYHRPECITVRGDITFQVDGQFYRSGSDYRIKVCK